MNKRIGEVGYNTKGEKITIIRYGGYEDIDVQFEDGIIVYNRSYGNFIKGKIKHPIRYEESFAYHIEVELGLNLDDIWNWDKNNELGINPYEIYKSSSKKVWMYCLKKDYHNYDREGNKVGYKTTCDRFYRGSRCGYCQSGISKIHYKDSLAYNYPNIAKMIAIPKNDLTFEDCYSVYCNSHKYYYFKCNICGGISDKKKQLKSIVRQGFSCKYCSDGIPITEKFMLNILEQLDINYIYQLTSKNFEWCHNFKYDFYLPKYNIIVETHGIQHYIENTDYNQTLNEIIINDLFKYKCAKNHIDNYIVIDFRYSELEWMKESIIKELGGYFDLSNINWELAWEESQKSKCVEAWELWNSGLHDTTEIGKILNIDRGTVVVYLKRGVECKRCDYTIEESKKNGFKKITGNNNYLSKSVICITTNKIFNTIKEAEKYYNCYGISRCCNNKSKTAGKLKDGTKLTWMFYEDYIKEGNYE